MSAGDVDVDGLAGDRGDEVVVGSRGTGVGARERLAGAYRAERALVHRNPTEDGVIDGMNGLENRGLDEMDGALVFITAIHHVCPQHEALMMGIMGPIAAEEICTKPS